MGLQKRFIMRADEKLTAFLELEAGDSQVRGEFALVIAALHGIVSLIGDGADLP